ncbi:MAG: rod shape-determining protein MreC [Ignavibacteriales bacterium]|nr:rod shape-determining protein MreC [Ignavibacteriales bacterium]
MLERLYNLFLHFREYVFLSGLVILSLVLLSLNDAPQVKQIRTIATVVLGVIQDRVSFFPAYLRLGTENSILRRTNIELADQANQLREARLENMRLRRLLELKGRGNYDFVAAKIVSKNLTLLRNTLTLDVGEADGVHTSMPVVHDAGLVGVVVAASRHYSVVNILLNTDFRASAKIQRSRVDGIVAWDGARLTLKNIAKTLDIQQGDVLLTSEYSSTYLPGIRIGLVSAISEKPGSLFKEVVIMPSVDFIKLEEVFVMTSVPDQERIDLEHQAEERFSR